jgi:hypothetical protein
MLLREEDIVRTCYHMSQSYLLSHVTVGLVINAVTVICYLASQHDDYAATCESHHVRTASLAMWRLPPPIKNWVGARKEGEVITLYE